MSSEPLYQDKQIKVYREAIVISKYFFPLATSKTILFSEMETVALVRSEGVTHRWGVSGKYLNNWFPLDTDRKNKKFFIEIVIKGKRIKPSITPDDPEAVFKLIWENHTKQGHEYKSRMSEQVGKETEVAQQEIMEREVEMKELQTTEQHLTTSSKKVQQQA